MTPLGSEGQILDFKNASQAIEPSPQVSNLASADSANFG